MAPITRTAVPLVVPPKPLARLYPWYLPIHLISWYRGSTGTVPVGRLALALSLGPARACARHCDTVTEY
eukprot:3940244-Rhodomonas_salina.3